MSWPAFITAAGSVLGGLLGGKGSSGNSSQSQTAPWLAQQLDIAQRASDLYGGDMSLPVWGGGYYAPAGSDQQASWDTLRSLAQGSPYVNQVWDMSRNLMGGNPFQPTAYQTQVPQIGSPAQAPGAGPASLAGFSKADTYYPTANFLDMARDATAQSQGRTIAGTGGLLGTIPGIGQFGSAMDMVGGVPTASLANASTNPLFGMDNPYTEKAIKAAQEDTIEAYNENVMPQLDRLMQQSGSFGNTGVQEMQKDAARNFSEELGQIANDMRYKDLFAQQGMGEAAANRGTNVSQFNAGAMNDMDKFGFGTRANLGMFDIGNDINRQRYNSELAANLGMFDINNILGTQKFNAGNLQQADQFNNAAINNMLQYGLGAVNRGEEFNSNWRNQIGTRNADASDVMARYNSGVGTWNAGAQNDVARRNAELAGTIGVSNTGFANAADQYGTGLNWQALQYGMNNMPWLQQQAYLAGSTLGGIGGQQQQNEQNILNSQMKSWQDVAMNPYLNMNMYADLIGKLSGGFNMNSSQNYPGSPIMGALGGATLGNYFGNMFGGQQAPNYLGSNLNMNLGNSYGGGGSPYSLYQPGVGFPNWTGN